MSEPAVFRAAVATFSIGGADVATVRWLGDLFAGAATDASADHHFEVSRHGDLFTLQRDTMVCVREVGAAEFAERFMWEVNQLAWKSTTDAALVHGAALAWRGRAIVLPAASESGKSTLAAALSERGAAYLSDEIAIVAFDASHVASHTKPITLRPGSWGLFPQLRDRAAAPYTSLVDRAWYVRPRATAHTAAPGLVVLPHFDHATAATELVPLARADAFMAIAQQTYNFDTIGTRGVDGLAAFVRASTCYRLHHGDLERACDLVLTAAEHTASR